MNTSLKKQMLKREGPQPASAEQRLSELGMKLPAPPEPFGTYAEAVQTGNLLFLSGMVPTESRGAQFIGRVGAELDVEAGRKAAHRATRELDALSSMAFDATDSDSLERFFRNLPTTIDHVMVTAGRPYYGRLVDMDFAEVREAINGHLMMALQVSRNATDKVRPGGTLLFMGGTGARRPAVGLALASALTAALPALTANLALELTPVRVNLIAAGFVDTPLSAELLDDQLENRRNQLRAMLPIRRVVGPADVAALAVHVMTNTALTGATYDIDGGQQLVAR